MVASYNDMSTLATDTTFGNRVQAALEQTIVAIENEGITTATLPQHVARLSYVKQVSSNITGFKTQFVAVCSVDATCIADATAGGTVVLTGANVAAQAALVTDAHILSAISAAFNTFVGGI